jgi:hypothetical protein
VRQNNLVATPIELVISYRKKGLLDLNLSLRQIAKIWEPMKKIIALVVLCSIGLTMGIAYFYVQRASELPEWYTDQPESAQPSNPVTSPSPATPSRTAIAIQEKIKAAKPGNIQEQLTAAEVDNLIVAGLTQSNGVTKALPAAVKGIKTHIQQDQISSGAIVDLAELEKMPASPRTEMMNKLLNIMPQLRDKPVYIGVAGKLSVRDGQPQLDSDSKIQIGKVELPLNDVAKQLGVSRSALEEQVTNYLQFRNLDIQTIDLTDQGAKITGKKK